MKILVSPMTDAPGADVGRVEAALVGFFAPRLKPGDRLCVGLSGGMDSMVLLHALRRLLGSGALPAVSFSAIHVHHGLSPRADDWAEFCGTRCARLAVPLTVVRVEVPRDSGEGLEGAARRRRHAVFAGVDADWLALAHHRGDQAETVLLNLLRGAGVSGAAGMPAARAQARGPALVRPLLGVERAALARYAEARGLEWVDDESNGDARFRRNFLRREILPRLEREFPGADAALTRAAGHFAEASALLGELAELDWAAVSSALSGRVLVAALNRLGPARAANLLRHLWARAGFRAPDTAWIGEALKQLATADALSETSVATADGELRVYRGELYLVQRCEAPPAEPIPWTGQSTLPWAGGQLCFAERVGEGLRRGALAGKMWISIRQGGERFQPDIRRPCRGLRNLLQERGVPPWERERLPLLWVDGRLAWVGGIGVDAAFACAPGEAGILPLWEEAIQGSRNAV